MMDEAIARLYKRLDGKGQAPCIEFLDKNFEPIYPFNHDSYHRIDLDADTPNIEVETGVVKEYIVNVFYVGSDILALYTLGILIPIPQAIQTALFTRIHDYFDGADSSLIDSDLRKYTDYVFNIIPRAHRHKIREVWEYKRLYDLMVGINTDIKGGLGMKPVADLLKKIYGDLTA